MPVQPMPDKLILDMHCHTAGIGAGDSGCFLNERMRKSWKYPLYLGAFGSTHDEVMREGDGAILRILSEGLRESRYVHGAVILAMDCVINEDGTEDWDRTELYIPNEFLVREFPKYDNLYYAASVHPNREDALERLEQAKADGAVLLKWLPAIHHINVADERYVPFYDKLAELDLPLLTHVGAERSFTTADHDAGDPVRLRLPLSRGVKVIAAHMASTGKIDGQRQIDRLIPLFDEFPNLYSDISSLTQINKLGFLAESIKQEKVVPRLLYGTDMPLPRTPVTSAWYFINYLTLPQILRIQQVKNPWDRDVLLKQALGVQPEIFQRPADFLNIAIPACDGATGCEQRNL